MKPTPSPSRRTCHPPLAAPALPDELYGALARTMEPGLGLVGTPLPASLQGWLLAQVWLDRSARLRDLLVFVDEDAGRRRPTNVTTVLAHTLEALCLWQEGKNAGPSLQQALAAVQAASPPCLLPLIAILGASSTLCGGHLPAAARHLQLLEATPPRNPELVIHTHHLRAWLSSLEGNLVRARIEAEQALSLAEGAGSLLQALCRLMSAQILQAQESSGAKTRVLAADALSQAKECGSTPLTLSALLLHGLMAFDSGNDGEGRRFLREGLQTGRLAGELRLHGFSPQALARLCGKALAAGIEPDYTRELIRLRGLHPPAEALHLANWPWPLRIYTLGRFGLVKEGLPVTFRGKVQQKPLELLKAIIALGGRDIPAERLCDLLWPNAPWEESHQALSTTLHRLRQLLGADGAVLKEEGRLSINTASVWVDLWAFHRLAGLAISMLEKGQDENVSQGLELGRQALALYSGPFLARHTVLTWCVPLRNRLQSRLVRLIRATGATHQRSHDMAQAIDCYRQGLELDDTAEELYCQLMACCGQAGMEGDLERVYERCRTSLAIKGAVPSSATREAYTRALSVCPKAPATAGEQSRRVAAPSPEVNMASERRGPPEMRHRRKPVD